MESQRPRGYQEYLSGDRSWETVGIRIRWSAPETPGESAHSLMEPLKARICVECRSHVSPHDVTACVWTCLVQQDNKTGIYQDIPMSYTDVSRRWSGNGVVVYEFETVLQPSQMGHFRLTYNVKLGNHMVWANVFRNDHIINVFGRGEVGQTTTKTTTYHLSQVERDTPASGKSTLNLINALAVQRSGMKGTFAYNADRSQDISNIDAACRDIIGQISSLEYLVKNLSGEFDARAVHLVNKSKAIDLSDECSSSMRASHDCLVSIRATWQWVFRSMQCAEVHLRHAAFYHEFFQNVEETNYCMNSSLSNIHLSLEEKCVDENKPECERMIDQIRYVLANYQQWQTKITQLYEQAKEVVPVPQRLATLKEARSVISLADFSSDEITCNEGETLMLLDNSDDKRWKVQSTTGITGEAPAILFLIPPPYQPALESALKLKLQFLAMWTNSVKRMGFQMIASMILILRDWTEEEVNLFQAIPASHKEKLLGVLRIIETELIKMWSGYGDFEELIERISRLIMILEGIPDVPAQGFTSRNIDNFLMTTVTQILRFEDMLKIYQEIFSQWEAYLNVMEMLKHPNLMLFCEKWEQLKFLKSSQFVRFWDSSIDVAKEDITKSRESYVLTQPPEERKSKMDVKTNVEVTIEDKIEEATTDTVTSITEEQLQTYIIKTVIDPTDGKTQISLQKAIMLGIIDQIQRTYVNPWTGVSISFSDAINKGMIVIEILKWEKIKEEKKSYGMITIKTTTESHPYNITGAVDPVTHVNLTLSEAIDKKVYDVEKKLYRTGTGELIALADAVRSGLLLTDAVDVDDVACVEGSQHVEEKTYAVHAVVDQKTKEKVSFSDAVRDGLLDKETGEYVNNATGVRTGVLEAILRGFIKARHVADPSKLDINPENAILVEKMQHATQKLITELKVLKAFKGFKK